MPTLRIQMHLHRSPSVLQRNVVNQRLVYTVHVVILRLQQKRWRRLTRDMNIRSQFEFFIVFGGSFSILIEVSPLLRADNQMSKIGFPVIPHFDPIEQPIDG
jgi:hypothetical protein